MKLLEVWSKAKADGVNVPKITFMSNFAPVATTAQFLTSVYKKLYEPGLYQDLWFYRDGKPLMIAYPQALPESEQNTAIKNFFTFRYPWAVNIFPFDETLSWGWAGYYPNKGFGKGKNGGFEQMAISVAVNAYGPMNNPRAWGRSYTHNNYKSSYVYAGQAIEVYPEMENSSNYGIFIQEQWDYIFEQDPDVVFITGWNEWTAMRLKEWEGYENAFPDQFNDEFSRDIEPTKGDLKDHYYNQLIANVRKYKGTTRPQAYTETNKIDIYGDLSQWNEVKAVYNHYVNNTLARNAAGYLNTKYKGDTMRNDIKSARVA